MVRWSALMQKIVEYVKQNINELDISGELTVVRMGDIDDVATSLPLIEVSGYPSFTLLTNVAHERVPIAKIDFYVHVTAHETPAKSFDVAADMALTLSSLLDKAKSFQVIRFTDITPVYYMNEEGRINYTDFATVQLGVEVRL